jgi:hypothetical protein
MIMKVLILFLINIIVVFNAAAQFPAHWCDDYTVKKFKGGQVINIPSCDSVWILNRKTFAVYNQVYDSVSTWNYKNNQNLQTCLNKVRSDSVDYEILRKEYNNLFNQSSAYLNSTRNITDSLGVSVDKVNRSLDAAQKNIEVTRDILKKYQKQEFERKLLWGICGVGLGIIAGIILF